MNKITPLRLTSDIQRRNAARLAVLGALRRAGPVPRADVGRLTGFSPASISAIVAGLMQDDVIVEQDDQAVTTGPGRPGIRLGFNPARGAAVGLWVGLNSIILQGVDLAGVPVARRSHSLPLARAGGQDVVAVVGRACLDFIAEEMAGLPVRALGVAFQGLIDQHAGSVVWSPVMAARELPLAAGLQQVLGIPVFMENDAAAMAYAICRHEPGLKTGFAACVMIGDGVGLGLLRDGVLLRGSRDGGSEFGHVQLDTSGPQCRCGARGCIESYLADYALYRDAVAMADLPGLGRLQPGEADMRALTGLATAGDPAVLKLFEGAGRALGRGLAVLVQLFQPDHIVLCGPGMRAQPFLEPAMRAEIERATLYPLRRNLRFVVVDYTPAQLTEGVVLQALEVIDAELATTTATQKGDLLRQA